jgi:hypothetical protein
MAFSPQFHGSACGPVIVPVFKTGGRQAILSPVGSTPTRFRHLKPASLLRICTLVPLNVLDSVLANVCQCEGTTHTRAVTSDVYIT